ncbi:MAG: TRAP transporter small permease [Marinagarivorans sp.]|nr:TRAP transporter small permease [Marinagarivorans sp.]
MNKTSNFLEKILGNFLALLLAAMVIDVVWQVISRYITNHPSSITEELARFLLIWIGLIGAAYAYRKHSHLSLDLLIRALKPSSQMLLNRAIQIITIAFASTCMVYGGFKLMMLTLTLHQTSAALGIPVGLVYSCIPLSGLLICWFAIDNFVSGVVPEDHSSAD